MLLYHALKFLQLLKEEYSSFNYILPDFSEHAGAYLLKQLKGMLGDGKKSANKISENCAAIPYFGSNFGVQWTMHAAGLTVDGAYLSLKVSQKEENCRATTTEISDGRMGRVFLFL